MKPHLALFDLDHTLLPLDSDYAWGEFTQRIGWTDPVVFKRRNDEFYADYQAGRLDIHEYVRFATEAVRLKGQVQAEAARAQFLREVIQPAVRPEAQALIQRHRDQGCQVMIVTATNEFVTRPIAQLFGIDELIAVELARDAQGWITGEIAGVPSMREGKVQRLQQWLLARGWDWQDVETTFYSDSTNDLPLLGRVNHPVATNPDDRLREQAQQRGWPVLELFPAS
ncbi:MAG: HAD family hydrolase [Limnohabitans sp.]|jgi:HAD superfamily hydrolase (TIGR01490 family)|nr:HAD family hydrolase [Limnohabitans sp.]